MNSGWIPLWRKVLNNKVWRNDPTAWRLYEALLLLCDQKTGQWSGGRYVLAEITGLKDTTVHAAIKRLRRHGMIEYTTTNRYTKVQILSIEEYANNTKTARTKRPLNLQKNRSEAQRRDGRPGVIKEVSVSIKEDKENKTPSAIEVQSKCNQNDTITIINNKQLNRIDKSILVRAEESARPKRWTDNDKLMVDKFYELLKTKWPMYVKKNPTEKDYELMNKIHRIDGHPYALIRDVIVWTHQDGNFWSRNILSVGKLRKQFSTLCINADQDFKQKRKERIFKVDD